MIVIIYLMLNFGLSWEYKSSRSLAMGGSSVTLRDPQTSFFMNPAAMRGTKSFDILSVELQVSEATLITISNLDFYSKAFSGKNINISDVKSFLGEFYGANLFYFPHFVVSVKNSSFGLGILTGFGTGLKSAVPSNIIFTDTFIFAGALPVLGGAFSILEDSVELGISIVPFQASTISRFEFRENEILSFDKIFPAISRGVDNLKDILDGNCKYPLDCAFSFGGFNVGLIWNPVWIKNFSIGLDVRDVLDPIRKTTADFGLSYIGKIYSSKYSVFLDFQDFIFTQSGSSDIFSHTFFGTEISFDLPQISRFFSIMFGLAQLNLSAGFEINLKLISFTFGTFAYELRQYIGGGSARYYFFKLAI